MAVWAPNSEADTNRETMGDRQCKYERNTQYNYDLVLAGEKLNPNYNDATFIVP